jgi:PAS domain S-box-containing protein
MPNMVPAPTTLGPALGAADSITEARVQAAVLIAGALQNAIRSSANFSTIATDDKGVIQIFNTGAEKMLGYAAADVIDKLTPAELFDPQQALERAQSLTLELGTPIAPGFEALSCKASRGLEDIHEQTYLRQDGSRLPAVVSVSALRSPQGGIIGYLLITTDNTARQQVEAEQRRWFEIREETNRQLQQANATLQASEEKLAVTLHSIGDAVIATDGEARVTLLNPLAERLTGWTQEQAKGHPVSDVFLIINQDTRHPVAAPVLETLARGTVQGLTNHILLLARDGTERSIADSCAPIRDRSGDVVGAVLVFRDVTEAYAVQQALNDSAAQIQTILNAVVDGIITLRASDGVVETFNPAAERLFGYDAAEVVGEGFSKLVPELDGDEHKANLAYYAASIEERAVGVGREVTGRRKDGTTFPIEMSVSEMTLGGERHFTGILRDISARKEAEAALVKVGALQSAIFASANFSIIATDTSGVIQIFSVGAERMLGYQATDVINKTTPAGFSDPQELVALAKALSLEFSRPVSPGFQALAFKATLGIEDTYELTKVRRDGSRFPAVITVTALRDTRDAIIGYLLISTDNTARKRVEAEQKLLDQRLRDQQFYTRSLIESNIDALMAINPSGIITDVNKQMEALTGCTRDELIGAPFKSHFTDPERAGASIERVLSEKKVRDYELTARARNGRETAVSFNATTFYDRDRTLQGVVVVARDVTERNRLDEVLRSKNAELESARVVADKANHAKSEFLSSMSHELRSPLNAILGFAQLMDSDSPPATPSQKASIDQILHAGWYLLELINEVLDLAVIESGKLSMSVEPVLLAEGMLECQAIIEQQGQKRGLQMTFPALDLPVYLLADRIRLKQILINLLSNAIKYNRPGGSVVVDLAGSTATRTRINVRDTGPGLSPAKLRQLFQPFNRLGRESGAEQGTGIGLVMSKLLVEQMGGVIGVESTEGEGSVFWFELDSTVALRITTESVDVSAAAHVHLARGMPPRTLLYVEDNSANLKLVEQLIARRPDMRLMSAGDGAAGIDLARDNLPEVILMDINLPGMNGFEALKILQEDPLTAHIPVVAISANAMQGDIKKGLDAGFFGYLTKPIDVREFMAALDVALEFAATRPTAAKGAEGAHD